MNWEDKRKQSVAAGRVIGGLLGTEKGGATVTGPGGICINGYTVVQAATAPTWSNLARKAVDHPMRTRQRARRRSSKTDRPDTIGLRAAIKRVANLIDGQEVSLSRNVKDRGLYFRVGTVRDISICSPLQDGEMAHGTKTGPCQSSHIDNGNGEYAQAVRLYRHGYQARRRRVLLYKVA